MTTKSETAPGLDGAGAEKALTRLHLNHIAHTGCPSCGSYALSIAFGLGRWRCNLCGAGTPIPRRKGDHGPERDHTAEDLADRYPTYEEA